MEIYSSRRLSLRVHYQHGGLDRGRGHHALHALPPSNVVVPLVSSTVNKKRKKEQASRCCTADVCGLCQSVNQLYNNQNMAKLVLFSIGARSNILSCRLQFGARRAIGLHVQRGGQAGDYHGRVLQGGFR